MIQNLLTTDNADFNFIQIFIRPENYFRLINEMFADVKLNSHHYQIRFKLIWVLTKLDVCTATIILVFCNVPPNNTCEIIYTRACG
jgi:hypothetical protein